MSEVRISVTGTNTSGQAVNAATRDVKELGEEGQKTAKRFVELGVSEERAAAEAGKMSRKIDQLGDDAGQLARKLLEAGVASKIAAEQFARYGDNDSLNNLRKAQKEVAQLSQVARHLSIGDGKSSLFDHLFRDAPKVAAKVGAESAGTFASAFQGGIMGTFKALPPEAQAALGASIVGVGIAAAPFIVSAVNGALLAGIGAGGLAAGIALQASDPVVGGKFIDLANRIQSDLVGATIPFRAQLLTVASDFDSSWTKIKPNMDGFFTTLAPSVSKLGSAISKSVESLGPALERAAGPASQVIAAIADEIPEIAGAVATLLDDISEHGDSAAEAIKFILFNVEALITAFDILVQTVGPAADEIVHIAEAMDLIDAPKLDHELSRLSSTVDDSGGTFNGMAVQMYNTADAADMLNSAFDRLFGIQMSVQEANLAVNKGLLSLRKSLKDNGATLDQHTEKGAKNAEAVLHQVDAYKEQRDAAIAAGNGTLEATNAANAAYNKNIAGLRKMLIAAGMTAASVDALIGTLYNIPDINRTITITTRYKVVGSPEGPRELGRGLSRDKAVGGVVGAVSSAAGGGMRQGLTKVGEEGWEYVQLPAGSQVYTHGQSQRMEQGGGGPIVVGLNVTGDSDSWLYNAVMEGFRKRFITVRQSAVTKG